MARVQVAFYGSTPNYAFIFDQKGLMAGVSIEGTKISHVRAK